MRQGRWFHHPLCFLAILSSSSLRLTITNALEPKPLVSRRQALARGGAIPWMSIAGGHLLPPPANAAHTTTTTTADRTNDILEKLQPASEDRPQIPLPNTSEANLSTLQGLMYYKNERGTRPPAGSVVLVTVTSDKDRSRVLAGAKFPVSRLPATIQLDRRNAYVGTSTSTSTENSRNADIWTEALQTQDLWVQAQTCLPEDILDRTQCAADQSQSLRATSLVKLLNIEQGGRQITIRSGVSLGLE